MEALEKELREAIAGQVQFDAVTCQVYSVDASIFEIEPLGVVIPKHKQDLVRTVQIAKRHGVPVIARGAATGIAGGCIGKGLIVDTSQFLRRILEVNEKEEYVILEPGVIQDQLNHALAKIGYRLGPDTSTGDRATLGGMLANNAAGAHSLRYGMMVDHVLEVELLLASGNLLRLKEIDGTTWHNKRTEKSEEGEIYRQLFRLRAEFREEIETHIPKIPRLASGYRLERLLRSDDSINPAELIAGSEGTLGIVTEMKLKICKKPQVTGLCLIHFEEMSEAFQSVNDLLAHYPLSLELVDETIITAGKSSLDLKDKLLWLQGAPKALFSVEFEAESVEALCKRLKSFDEELEKQQIGYFRSLLIDPKKVANFWKLRKAGLGLLLSKRSYSRALAFIEDFALPPEKLSPFMEAFDRYLSSLNKKAGIYGHVGAGCLHVRPYVDLQSPKELAQMKEMMLHVTSLLLKYGGVLSGEHGDGVARSWLNRELFGEKLYSAFVLLKHAFDPDGQMNPGKIVEGEDLLTHLRRLPKKEEVTPFLNYAREGGFELAVDLCNGNGRCRKQKQVMCPSYQVTLEEFHSTRARAQTLRSIVNGRLGVQGMTDPRVKDVLDLCLECKGCKGECPSQVDMAKLKAEFLYHYHKKHGVPFRDKLFAHLPDFASIASRFPKLSNRLLSSSLVKGGQQLLGIAKERTLPLFAHETFSSSLSRLNIKPVHRKKVVLLNDTFTEFYHPEVGIHAFHVLRALGYDPIVPSWHCCGRPLISKGFLKQAKNKAELLLNKLYGYASCEIPIVGLEPSCLLTLTDDYPGLLDNDPRCKTLEENAMLFDTFLARHLKDGVLPLPLKAHGRPLHLHGHCHQKSLIGMSDTLHVLRALGEEEVSEIKSGCCGMAGSFGYEKEHYALSQKIAEKALFPALRTISIEADIVANGISCRSQIVQGTKRRSKHLAEVVGERLDVSLDYVNTYLKCE